MLSERERAVLYRRLTDMVGDEEAVGAMLSHFPASDLDRPASEGMLQASEARLRAELHATTNRIILWNIGFTVTWSGVLLAAVRFSS